MMSHKHNYHKAGQETRIEGSFKITDISEECNNRETPCDRRIKITTKKEKFNHRHHFIIVNAKPVPGAGYRLTVKCTNTTACPMGGETATVMREQPRL